MRTWNAETVESSISEVSPEGESQQNTDIGIFI
jgi:hypothetical protein